MVKKKKKVSSPKLSFKGWNLWKFIKGRRKLIVAAVGYAVGWVTTQHPVYAGIVAGGAELVYALMDYFIPEKK